MFTGWSEHTAQDGWTVIDNAGNGQTWDFSDPGHLPYPPPDTNGELRQRGLPLLRSRGGSQDTSLVSPVINLAGVTKPVIGFDETPVHGHCLQRQRRLC